MQWTARKTTLGIAARRSAAACSRWRHTLRAGVLRGRARVVCSACHANCCGWLMAGGASGAAPRLSRDPHNKSHTVCGNPPKEEEGKGTALGGQRSRRSSRSPDISI